MTVRPLHNLLHVRLARPPERTSGGVLLPDSAREPVGDALVLARGPGKVYPNGFRYDFNVATGDRCVFSLSDLLCRMGEDEALIADDRLIAAIPGPEHDLAVAVNDWVFLSPESRKEETTESGVVVVHHALPGGSAQMKRRGFELYSELQALGEGEAWKTAPTEYDAHRVVWDFLTALSPDELAELRRQVQDGPCEQWRAYLPLRQKLPPRWGVVQDYGEGRISAEGDLVGTPAVTLGQKVWLEKHYLGQWVNNGEERLLAVPAWCVAAVEA